MRKILSALTLLVALVSLTSCDGGHFREDKVFAGGLYVKKETLNKGKQIYTEFCMPCHGDKGDGKGVAAKAMKVPPRDFTTGVFKFGEVIAGELPHDKHLYTLLEKGLHGTAMLPWDLTEGQMFAVVQYIKTFAPNVWEGKDKTLGEQIVMKKDPYGIAHKKAAIEAGKKIYHGDAACHSCHRAYLSKEDLGKITGEKASEIADDVYDVKPQETEWGFKSIPPDFTWHTVRSATTVEELYMRLSAGVGGTAMPSWKETITDEQIWAVAHYVKYLMDFKDAANRKEFMSSMK